MLVLQPVLTLGACILACVPRARCWRVASVNGAVLWGALLVGITEVLSSFHGLTRVGLSIAWLLVFVVAAARIARARTRPGVSLPHLPLKSLTLGLLLVPLALLLAVLFGIAVLSPPNTWDSMSYHMARLIHWQESGSVALYPAYVLRQLYMPPGAEFVMLHLQILSGGDRLAGLVQWASMIGALIGTSLIARQLGAGRAGQVCAVIFAASVPIGIVEATSTQNDQVLAFWLVCGVVFALRLIGSTTSAIPWGTAAGFGASLGLAILTKATAYIWAAPVVIWVGISLLRGERKQRLAALAVSGAIALLMNAGVYSRNLAAFGSPLGQTDEGIPSLRYLNDSVEPGLVASNLVRDLGINLVATPFPAVNAQGEAAVVAIHKWLGVDLTDPRTTWSGERFRAQDPGLAFNESFASNPVHLVAILVSMAALWPMRGALSSRTVQYAAVVTGGLLLFAAVVRWQPWHTRLELPFFVLGAPLVAVVLERASIRLTYVVAVCLLVCMVPWVIANDTRSLIGPRSILNFSRTDQYFTNWPNVRTQYLDALGILTSRGCTRVGFMSSADGWEYPLWALLPGVQEIEQISVPNVSAGLTSAGDREFRPCGVLALGDAVRTTVELNGQTYQAIWTAGKNLESVAVLSPIQPP
ncbi:MAG: hypothetical protein ACR2IK_21030 [Chloroflexota bacterium]